MQAKFGHALVCLTLIASAGGAFGSACQQSSSNVDDGSGGGGAGGDDDGGSNGQSAGESGSAGTTQSGGAAGSTNTGSGGSAAGTSGGGTSGGGAGGGGAGAGGGAASVACDPAKVCDDFESYAPGGGLSPWRQNGVNGTAKVDKTHAFSGEQSVQIVSPPGSNQRMQLQRMGAPLFPTLNNVLWGRMMVWANQLPGQSDKESKNVHYDVVQATGTTAGEYRVAGMGGVLLNYEPHDCYFGTNKVIPQNKWVCWEWLFDGSKNTIELYFDGQLQARVVERGQGCVDGTNSVWAAPAAFTQLRIGFVNYQSKAETTTLWIDDFAAGPTRLGCPEAGPSSH